MWQLILEVVAVVSDLASVGIAGFGAWLAWRTFVGDSVQTAEAPSEMPLPAAAPTAAESAPPLKLFETKRQTTWLKATEKGLECHLTERRPGKTGGHKWTMAPDEVKRILESSDFYVNPTLKISTGLLSIGSRRNWLYSKKLFPEPEQLHHEIAKLLRSVPT